MSSYFPYIVSHIQLDKPLDTDLFPSIEQAGYYCVFWWKQIPLAHLYVERNRIMDRKELMKEILDAIAPAIDDYLRLNGRKTNGYKDIFLQDEFRPFADRMNVIFKNFTPTSYPSQVNVSLIICTRNRSEYLRRCLDSLQTLIAAPSEIIVVDNAPDDDSSREVAALYNGVTYCVEPRAGLDIARNTGAQNALAPIIAYVDDDVIVHPLLTYEIYKTFADTGAAAMTGLIIASSLDTPSQQIFEKNWSFNRGYEEKTFSNDFIKNSLKKGPPVWEIGAGANMAFRKSVLDEVGYFDERLDVGAAGCSGDSELWFRILEKGYEIHYCPRAVVYHEHRKDIPALQKQIYNYMRGHAVAALIQLSHNSEAGYKRRLYLELPINYIRILLKNFPNYSSRYQTIFTEIRGIISGIIFFQKHRTHPSNIRLSSKTSTTVFSYKDA